VVGSSFLTRLSASCLGLRFVGGALRSTALDAGPKGGHQIYDVVGFVLIFAPADRNGGAVAQSGTMRAPDSSGPIVTSVMIAAGFRNYRSKTGT
jgi:hypothetical protein